MPSKLEESMQRFHEEQKIRLALSESNLAKKVGVDLEHPSTPSGPLSDERLSQNDVLSRLREIEVELEGLNERRIRLELKRDTLRDTLLETVDRVLEAERVREHVSRGGHAPSKVVYRCRYCVRQTKNLYGNLPVCKECQSQLEYIAVMEAAENG